ncbi:hypothetical protein LRS03_08920 [Rhizobacter sp. J219]|uniref:hypothetical protein n=1 Tax=Rhizobacter sp. J219 TaxID=2898430 RepID=UPI0021516B81|nr:hypothetical protein [Rhizobacter sp. J219]MCR5882970.1 hypothetical protein [Rhizobacter sp. J219]
MNPGPAALEVRLPEALLNDFGWAEGLTGARHVLLVIPADYPQLSTAAPAASEVIGIQRLISLARKAVIGVAWDAQAWEKVRAQPALFPLLSAVLALRQVQHWTQGAEARVSLDVSATQRAVTTHRLAKAAAFASDLAICVEGAGDGLSGDIYDPRTLRLHPRSFFESLAVEALTTGTVTVEAAERLYKNASLLGTMLAELIENSDMHGRLDASGRPILEAGLRGLVFRRLTLPMHIPRAGKDSPTTRDVPCFEASIFDSGIGYFASYTRAPLQPDTDLKLEWQVLHNCLERHYFPKLADGRPGHRGMGLYEVLRALQVLKGRIEFRTGRLYAYRTFLQGELQAQMKPKAPLAHLAWPEPRLLDHDKKYVAIPTQHEVLVGSSVRIIVPLD